MGNITGKQWLSITVAVLSVLMISTTQLTDLFGSNVAKTLVTVAGLANTIISSVVAALSSQSSLLHDVRSMPGVEHIEVNAQANQTLARLAVDPSENKIAPSRGAMDAVTRTAEGSPQ
jgi:hypothetical protein